MIHTSGHFSLASYRRFIVRCYCTSGGGSGGRFYALDSESKSTAAGFYLGPSNTSQAGGGSYPPATPTPYTPVTHPLYGMSTAQIRCNLQRCATTCASESETAWAVVKVPVNGRFPADELARRAPGLLVTSARAGCAESHSHIAPNSKTPDQSSQTPLNNQMPYRTTAIHMPM
jgi:hypothetical protein